MKETKSLTYIYFLLCMCMIIAVILPTQQWDDTDRTPALAKKGIDWDNLKAIPVQKEGRVMPFDSFARVLLTQISGKSSVKVNGKKISAAQWLAETIFAGTTEDYKIFLIENPRVMEAIKVEYKADRDRYSYKVLKTQIDLINQYAAQAARVEQEKRSIFQNQIIHLSNNVFQYQSLINSLSFWKKRRDLAGIDTFYTTIVSELNAVRVENPNMSPKYRQIIQSIITYPYEKQVGVSVARFMHHLYFAGEIFAKFNKMKLSQKIMDITKSLENKNIQKMYSESFTMVPPPQRLINFLETVKKSGGEDELPRDMEKEFKIYISNYLNGKVIKKVAKHKYKLTQQGEKVLEDVDQEWKAPWYVFLSTLSNPDDTRRDSLSSLNMIHYGFSNNSISDINNGIKGVKDFNNKMLSDKTTKKVSLEVSYNRYDLFFWCVVLYLASAIFCLISWLGWAKRPLFFVSLFFLIVAFICHSWGITLRMIIKERPPVSTLYESIVFASWVGVGIAMIMEYFSRASKSISLFTGAISGYILMAIAGKYAMDGDNMAVLVAVLDSNFWLSTHVTSMVIGYSACLVAGAIGHIYVLMHLMPNTNQKQAKEVGKLVYGTLCFGTIIAFLGTILGGLWADQSWGRFWGWDPKENGAMLIVLWSVILLHARLGGYIRDWGLALGAVFGNIVVAAAWWGVNLLSVGLHNYGFTQGLFNKLAIFTVAELLFIAFGMVLWYKKQGGKSTKTPKAATA
ncbi:cytochrome c biogenesis protein [Candidatus Uabimicrobium amorphum]|uniref:Cytochrome c biogenesis protein n=1 Tax=Uabimicrobium amorphum TaxID=2596890 RepID=A0A5S9IKA2_UABAM|nr:cytochrome c biogenesis protein CcsA [Candidatus Uabimicrobium amorphum]BBM83097.1 cytochrome c biogenesis protein [Candidatus Uabimicrobium amorphum]